MARNRKKLQKSDINRNSSSQLSHSIKKIKENERKYTFFLVIFFMILFCFIGYRVLSVNRMVLFQDITQMKSQNNLSSTSSLITLATDSILSDQEGLSSLPHLITIHNNTLEAISYRITFVQDDIYTDLCECREKTVDVSFIRYSLDGKTVQENLEENSLVISEGVLEKGEVVNLSVWMWISNLLENRDVHFHGYFIVEEI